MPIPTATGRPDHVTMRGSAVTRIRDAILDGTLEPGERLRDDELMPWLGISRTPIREALRELVHAGLVETAPNRYTRVATPDPAVIIDALRALGVLFAGVARITVGACSDVHRAAIGEQLDWMMERLDDGDARTVTRRITHTYDLWLAACPNHRLSTTVGLAMPGLAYKLRIDELDRFLDRSEMQAGLRELRAAVDVCDAMRATRAMEDLHQLPRR